MVYIYKENPFTYIWFRGRENARGQPLEYMLGNWKNTEFEYDDFSLPVSIKTGNIQNFFYKFDPRNGNLTYRCDSLRNRSLKESFFYDEIDRLERVEMNGIVKMRLNYSGSGNILQKTGLDDYTYRPERPHGVVHVSGYNAPHGVTEQRVNYNSFQKAIYIEDELNQLHIKYGVHQERVRTLRYYDYSIREEKIFAANYEKKTTWLPNTTLRTTRHYNYVNCPYGAIAMFMEQESGTGELFYLYKDHLGSITTITDQTGGVVEEHSYDAWGRLRNPNDWTYVDVPGFSLLDRGYTFHEHLEQFGLINMNGRLYDPVIARFLSPDPYIQDPGSSQGFNGYTYCLNNPLKYTDPSGNIAIEAIAIAVGVSAAISAASYTIHVAFSPGGFQNWNTGDFFRSIGIGALSGLTSWGIGQGMTAFASVASGSFGGMAVTAALQATYHGLSGMALSGDVSGRQFAASAASSAVSSLVNNGLANIPNSALRGTITATSSALMGGTISAVSGGNFMEGAARGLVIALFNHLIHKGGKSWLKSSTNEKIYNLLMEIKANHPGVINLREMYEDYPSTYSTWGEVYEAYVQLEKGGPVIPMAVDVNRIKNMEIYTRHKSDKTYIYRDINGKLVRGRWFMDSEFIQGDWIYYEHRGPNWSGYKLRITFPEKYQEYFENFIYEGKP